MTEEHHKEKKEHHKKKSKNFNWKAVSIILVVVLGISIFTQGFSSFSGVSESKATDKVSNYIESLLGQEPEISNFVKESGLYKFDVTLAGQKFESYLSKDGKLLFPSAVDLEEEDKTQEQTQEPETQDIPKTEKPKVEAFVMSHCPYGTQIEKGLISVVELLKDKIDFEFKFVDYAMHGETEVKEQLNQYCIQKEQNGKFLTYLKCFLKDGDSETCISEAGVDTEKLETCKTETDEKYGITESLNNKEEWKGNFPPFAIYEEENQEYGVRGSPTLVINEVTASSARDSQSLLTTICGAFTEVPEECEETLDSTPPAPGFGFEATGTDTQAQC